MVFRTKAWTVLFILLNAVILKADHLAGGCINYKLIDAQNGVYEIQLSIYRPCDKGSLPNSLSITMQNCANQFYKTSMSLANSELIQSQCLPNNVNCSLGVTFQKNTYKGTVFIGRQCGYRLVYYEDDFRSVSNTLTNSNEKLYLQTIVNTNYENQGAELVALDEYNQFAMNNTVYKLYTVKDVERDSVCVSIEAPLNSSNLTSIFQPNSAILTPPLTSSRPLYINEFSLKFDDSLKAISFTPNLVSTGWLTKRIKEFRKIKNVIGQDTVVLLGESFHDEYIRITSPQEAVKYDQSSSSNPNLKVQGQTITVCRSDQSTNFETRFLILKSTISIRDTIVLPYTNAISYNSVLKIGNGFYDTLVYSFQCQPNQIDQVGFIKFQFNYCDQSNRSLSNQFVLKLQWFQSKVFEKDTIKVCTNNDTAFLKINNDKSIIFSIGNMVSSDTLAIYPIVSGYIYASIVNSNIQCPSNDSVYILKGDKITTQWTIRPTTCFLGQNGFARVTCSGLGGPYSFHWPDQTLIDSNSHLSAGTYQVTIVDKNDCSISQTVLITQPEGVQSIWTVDSAITCHGDSNGVGHFSFRGLRPSHILWQGNVTLDSTFRGLKAQYYFGSFSYQNSLSYSCVQPFGVEIVQPDSVSFTCLTKDLTCNRSNDGIIAINPSGGNSYYKYFINASEYPISSLYGLSAGIYQVYVKDIKGCQSTTRSIPIYQPSPIIPSIQLKAPSCNEVPNGELKIVSITGAQGKVGAFLNSISTYNNVYSNLKTHTNYQLHIEDNFGCTYDSTFYLMPLYHLSNSLLDVHSLTCSNINNGSITVKINNGVSPYLLDSSYQYFVYNDTIKVIALNKGTYQITAKDSNLCPTILQFSISGPSSPIIQPIISKPSCFGYLDASIKLNISGATPPYTQYQWNTSPISNTLDISNVDSGTYVFKFVDANNCNFSDTFTIPSAPLFTLEIEEQKPVSCFNATDAILKPKITGGTPSFLYRWNYSMFSKDSIYLNASPLNVYDLDVYGQDGCMVHASYQPKNPPKISLEQLKLKPSSCPENNDGVIDVQAKGGYPFANGRYQYALSSMAFKDRGQFTNLFPGQYYLLVKDSQNCIIGDSITLEADKQIVLHLDTSSVELEPGQSVDMLSAPFFKNILLSDIKQIRWTPSEGVSCADCFHPSITPYKSTEYMLEVIYGNMCKTSAKTMLRVKAIKDIFIPKSFSPNRDGINDTWKIFGKYIGGFNLEVCNRWGEKVFSSNNCLFEWAGDFKGSILPSDEYIYHMNVNYLDGQSKKYDGLLYLIR
jgi:gliding motility-associated-like protein